ncbi:MAG: UDP-N-acetylmuramate--L-alanine ligase [Bacteroidales bacterium]|nr:UDP-N-acetylmuramate--L-alanine ligase [Bacteroidales bacterium]
MSHSHIYFVGIGGIGMSNLARYFKTKGKVVAGYDRSKSTLTKELEAEGIAVHYTDDVAAIPAGFLNNGSTLVVRTPAVPESHSELRFFNDNGYKVLKRAQVLGMISNDSRSLCIAGTHGKTTTTTMTAHLLKQSGVDCSAFLGGISNNYHTNLLLSDHSDLTVIEADEYDRSFHQLTPYMAVITAVDADHLDIYKTHAEYLESFAHFTELIRPDGCLVIKKGLPLKPRVALGVKVYTYSVKEKADFFAEKVHYDTGRLFFDFNYPGGVIRDIELGVPIQVNVENAVAALALAHLNGVTDEELRAGLATFRGTWRRFDFQIRRDDFVYLDDYAHHPEELRASISSIKALFPGKKITGIFQPHLYSRTRDFADEFASVLSELDNLILLDIYPAREQPIPGVTSEMILEKVTLKFKTITTLDKIFEVLDTMKPEILVTLGAGSIDTLVPLIKRRYEAC